MNMTEQLVLKPQPGPQELYCAAMQDIVLYAGAAGGGKSYVMLLDVLRHIDDPDFRGVIFRRTSTDLKKPGGLWDEAKAMWRGFGCVFKDSTLKAIFPSGAFIQFSHMEREDDKRTWQGAQLTFVGFDEAKRVASYMVTYSK